MEQTLARRGSFLAQHMDHPRVDSFARAALSPWPTPPPFAIQRNRVEEIFAGESSFRREQEEIFGQVIFPL